MSGQYYCLYCPAIVVVNHEKNICPHIINQLLSLNWKIFPSGKQYYPHSQARSGNIVVPSGNIFQYKGNNWYLYIYMYIYVIIIILSSFCHHHHHHHHHFSRSICTLTDKRDPKCHCWRDKL